MAAEAMDMGAWLAPHSAKRKVYSVYSVLRIGREALVRRWPLGSPTQCLESLKSLPHDVLEQTGFAA